MSLYSATLTPGKSLGIFTLGQTLYEITTRIKAEPKTYAKLDVILAQEPSAIKPIILSLPNQGIRLRFDGPEQRLRLIEVTDFSKNTLIYKDQEIVPKASTSSTSRFGNEPVTGPTFKHIYSKTFGPTFSGEYVHTTELKGYGTYALSYPGISFNFPVKASAWNPQKDFAAILSSPATLCSSSLAIFSGPNWPDARKTLFSAPLEDPMLNSPNNKEKLPYPDEIGMVHILGSGQLRMDRAYGAGHFWIQLGQTTPQELVAELGPPDAIYRKSDPHLAIHKARANSGNSESTTGSTSAPDDRAYDSHDDSSSAPSDAATPDGTAPNSSEESSLDESADDSSGEDDIAAAEEDCFYNYFHHGFDILIARPIAPSPAPTSTLAHTPESSPESASSGGRSDPKSLRETDISHTSAPLVATKIILHGNIPGTYAFGRHRRIAWRLSYLPNAISSSSPYPEISNALRAEWRGVDVTPEEERQRTRGMSLNRGWGESVGSSMEVLGGWEEGRGAAQGGKGNGGKTGRGEVNCSMLYGWPGLVFEVGKGGIVGGLTVF